MGTDGAWRLTVGRDGLVKQCDLTDTSGRVPSRPKACATLREWARFYPATASSSEPVEADTALTLRWAAQR